MQQDNRNSEELKQSYFKIKSSAVLHLRDLVHDLKSNKNLELKDIPDPILKVYREINKV